MVREFKFRAWAHASRVMFKPDSEENAFHFVDGWVYDLPNVTLMQYTGQQDYNGDPVYEGDIVRGGDELAVIEWNEDAWSARLLKNKTGFDDWMPPTHTKGWRFGNLSEFISYAKHVVIGNRYENPELFND